MKNVALLLSLFAVAGCTVESGTSRSSEPAELPDQKTVTPAPGSGSSSEPGAPPQFELPSWQREDVQPESARFGQTYGLEAFRGKAVVVTLLEGHCPFCQSNSVVAQQLQDELTTQGLDVQIVVLGDANATQFASRVKLPIFKDADGSAWDAMRPNASKHDTFVFGPDGKRTYFLQGTYQGEPAKWRSEIGAEVRKVAPQRAR
jgi:hypothetical protein